MSFTGVFRRPVSRYYLYWPGKKDVVLSVDGVIVSVPAADKVMVAPARFCSYVRDGRPLPGTLVITDQFTDSGQMKFDASAYMEQCTKNMEQTFRDGLVWCQDPKDLDAAIAEAKRVYEGTQERLDLAMIDAHARRQAAAQASGQQLPPIAVEQQLELNAAYARQARRQQEREAAVRAAEEAAFDEPELTAITGEHVLAQAKAAGVKVAPLHVKALRENNPDVMAKVAEKIAEAQGGEAA